jgi:cell division protein FtsB
VFNRFISQYNTLSYQPQIILLICGFGAVRIVLALVMDFTTHVPRADLMIDLLLLITIITFVYTSWRKEFEKIGIQFGVAITLLLAFNFLQFGGIAGYGRFNYFASIYFIVMVYSQRALYITISFNMLLLLVVLYISNTSPAWLSHIDFGVSFQTLDFWFTLMLISVFTIYLKDLTVTQGNKLSQLNLQMAEQVRESRKLGRKLEQSNQELKRAQANLEDEVSRRTEMLRKKNKSVETFIELNTTELIQAVDELLASMHNVKSSSAYTDKLKLSSEELNGVVESIRTSLKQNTLLDRTVIRNHERNA